VVRLRRRALRWSAGRCRRATLFPWLIMNHLPPASTPKDADSTPAMGRIGAMRRQFTGRGLGPERKKMDKRRGAWRRRCRVESTGRARPRAVRKVGIPGFEIHRAVDCTRARRVAGIHPRSPLRRASHRPSLSHLKKRGEPQNPETLKKSHRKGAVKAGAARGRRLGRAKRRRDRYRTPHRSA